MKVLGMTDALTSPISSLRLYAPLPRAPFPRPGSRISKDHPPLSNCSTVAVLLPDGLLTIARSFVPLGKTFFNVQPTREFIFFGLVE